MRPDRFDTPWRPNYEAVAVAVWLACAAYLAWRIEDAAFVPPPYRWALALCLAMGAWRAVPAARIAWHRHRLGAFEGLWRLSAAALARRARREPDRLWLGRGFEWRARHLQLAQDLLAAGLGARRAGEGGRMGSPWLHGLSLRERDLAIPLEHLQGHVLIVGTTRSGKTRLFDLLVTQAVLRGEAVIVIDPKGDRDLREAARRACALAGAPERFVYFHPAFPGESAAIDPLRHFNRPSELASRIAELIPSETGADPFKAFGHMALANIVQGLIAIGERVTLLKLRHHLESGPDDLVAAVITAHAERTDPGARAAIERCTRQARARSERAAALIRYYRERLEPSHPSVVVEGLASMFEHERAHFGKMVASLMPIMNMLTSGELAGLLSPADAGPGGGERLDMSRVIRRAEVAYIGLDALSDAMVGSALGSILLADLAAVAGDRYNYAAGERPVSVFVDEAAEVINAPMVQLLNKGAGAGLRLYVATQTFADFAARTGSEARARQVLGNMNNLVALRTLDTETQRYIADSLPRARVRRLVRTQGTSTDARHPLLFAGTHGERLVEEETELFSPALLGELPDLHYLARLSGGRVVKGRLPVLAAGPAPA